VRRQNRLELQNGLSRASKYCWRLQLQQRTKMARCLFSSAEGQTPACAAELSSLHAGKTGLPCFCCVLGESLASALPTSTGWLWPQLARARQPTVNTKREPCGRCREPGLLGQEQPPIPESLLTANGEKMCPSKIPSLMVPVSPVFDFKGLVNKERTLWAG